MKRVLSVTEPGHPKGTLVTSTLDGPAFGIFGWLLIAGLLVVLSQDSLKVWHIPAILSFWPLLALGWIVRQVLWIRRR